MMKLITTCSTGLSVFEIYVPVDADESAVDELVERAVFDEAVSYFNWHEGSDDEE